MRSDDLTAVVGGSLLVGDRIRRNASGISTRLPFKRHMPIPMSMPYTLVLHLGRCVIATAEKHAKATN